MRDTSKDIFVRHLVDFKLNSITHCQVQNEMMLVAQNGQSLFHMRLQNGRLTNLKLAIDPNDRIAFIHIDFSGSHAMVSTAQGENYYVDMRSVAIRPLRRLKGHVVSAIGWNLELSSTETGFIVLGTLNNHLYETNISSTGTIQYLRLLSSGLAPELAISGLFLRQFPEGDAEYHLLLVCMPNRLYCLVGPPNPLAINQPAPQPVQQVVGTVWSSVMVEQQQPEREATLQMLFNFRADQPPRYLCMDAEERPPSALCVFPISTDEPQFRFGWLSAGGIALGTVDTDRQRKMDLPDGYDLMAIDFTVKHRLFEGRVDYPLDMALTEYHLLLLFSSRLAAISLLERGNAFEDFFTGVPKLVGMCRDASSQLNWVFAESALFKYAPNDETRHVWRFYLANGEFGKAKKIANRLSDKRPFQLIIKKEAEKFLADKNFVAAAESLAQSDAPFEQLVLGLLRDGTAARNGLKRFLELKLGQLRDNEERMQRDILVLWLLEIQLAELAELRRGISGGGTDSAKEDSPPVAAVAQLLPSARKLSSDGSPVQKEAEIGRLKEQLRCFLNRVIVFEAVTDNREAVYRMISSHVDFDTQLYLAKKLRDHEVVIKLLLMRGAHREVLDILVREARAKLFHEHAAELIEHVPAELTAALAKQMDRGGDGLNIMKLLPAFHLCFDQQQPKRKEMADAVFAFFDRFSPSQLPSPVIDFCIHLYATFRPDMLLDYLKRSHSTSSSFPRFDIGQSLRLCTENGLRECCVFLLCAEGLYEEAVKLALQISLPCAKECARHLETELHRRAQDDLSLVIDHQLGEEQQPVVAIGTPTKETQKRVWLEIVNNVIKKGAPIADCLALLEETGGAVRIQDVLAHFPEFTRIEHFKEPLCACLKEHSNEIRRLQSEIREVTGMAEELRVETEKSRSSFMVVRASDRCSMCTDALLTRPFIAFVCRHFFHRNCLEDKVKMCSEEYRKLEREKRLLSKDLEIARVNVETTPSEGTSAVPSQLQQLLVGRRRGENARARGKEGGSAAAAAKKMEATAQRLETVNERMRQLLHGDCPLCGTDTIEAVDRPFFRSAREYGEELEKWLP